MRVVYSLLAGSSLAAIPLTMTYDLLDSLSWKTVPKLTTSSLKVIVCMRDWFQSFTLLERGHHHCMISSASCTNSYFNLDILLIVCSVAGTLSSYRLISA